jgi:hypothetical protein
MRVSVWRKLKQLGALLLHDSSWVLPANERNREQLQWLTVEIGESKGKATLARAQLLSPDQEQQLVRLFQDQADEAYHEVLTGLKSKKRDLSALSRRFQQAQALDFFHSKLASRTRNALLAARRDKKT